MPNATRSQQPKLPAEGRQVPHLHYGSIPTERFSVNWNVQFIHSDGMRLHEVLFPAEPKISTFSMDLVVRARDSRNPIRRSG